MCNCNHLYIFVLYKKHRNNHHHKRNLKKNHNFMARFVGIDQYPYGVQLSQQHTKTCACSSWRQHWSRIGVKRGDKRFSDPYSATARKHPRHSSSILDHFRENVVTDEAILAKYADLRLNCFIPEEMFLHLVTGSTCS